MRQLVQHLKSGVSELADVPAPGPVNGRLLIQSRRSLISAGTERMLVSFSKASLLGKARAQPERVKQVLEKVKADGLLPTLDAVFSRLDEPMPLGYCHVGCVLDTGGLTDGVSGVSAGDRVVSNGHHAEIVSVPHNLCAKIPDGVSDDEAAFTVIASIALQGIRLAKPMLGERFVVYGLGLIGLLAVKLLRLHGCSVLGIDLDPERLALAEAFGAETVNAGLADPVSAAMQWTGGRGVDGVIIAASAKTDAIVHDAAGMSRKRGRIILVGVVGLKLKRSDFYEKELTFQVSCSYGPGRYDAAYEEKGQDYPYGFVRWTEQRNFEAVLDLFAQGRLDVKPLISHRFNFAMAPRAYQVLLKEPRALGILLTYDDRLDDRAAVSVKPAARTRKAVFAPASRAQPSCVAGLIGAGQFARSVLAPALSKSGARLKYVAARTNGAAAQHIAGKHGFEQATTSLDAILDDAEVNAVFICTRPDVHVALTLKAFSAGKHVFVEKPMAIHPEGLSELVDKRPGYAHLHYMVGFNRRFSPHVVRMKQCLSGRRAPLAMTYEINAGILPADHWCHDPRVNGGRIIGEACHFIDTLAFLAGSPVTSVSAMAMFEGERMCEDRMTVALSFADGSVGSVNYFGNGHKACPKELLSVYCDGRVLKLNNFRKLVGHGFRDFRSFRTLRQNKGHQAEVLAFVRDMTEGRAPSMLWPGCVNVTQAAFAAVASAREGRVIEL